jgi:uncharacterized membrane-anchored protein YitT (DUF2179 family)
MKIRPKAHPGALKELRAYLKAMVFNWKTLRDYGFLLAGALIQALAMRMFLVPAQLISGGVSGAAQIIYSFTGWPIGLMTLIGNVPLFFLGWRFLGGPRFALRTAFAVTTFSLLTDLSFWVVPGPGLTDDLVLNCLYGAIMLGVGLGLVYRGQGTSGGSDILGRILNFRMGVPIAQSYLLTDTLVVLASGIAFASWKLALYAVLVIYVSGLAAEAVSEGSSIFRTAMIITSQPDQVCEKIMYEMERGVTILPGTGGFTGSPRPVLYCVITRSEVNQLKALVSEVDPQAFMVIGIAHEALGEGFRSFSSRG